MIDAAFTSQLFSQPELTLNERDSTLTQSDAAILPGLVTSIVNPENTSFGGTQHGVSCIVVCDDESNFLRRAESSEKT